MRSLNREHVLVLSPHSDDEVIGAGGFIHRLGVQGGEVTIAYASVDEVRLNEALAGLEVLHPGAKTRVLGRKRNPTDWLDKDSVGLLCARIETLIDEIQPDTVLLPDPGGFHQEHRYVAEAAMAAMRPTGGTVHFRPPVVATFEEPTDVWRIAEPMRPTWFVTLDQADVIAKQRALDMHGSQTRNWPSERSNRALEALAELRGAQAGVDYAEAFTILRWLS